jgi:hypothetical protein
MKPRTPPLISGYARSSSTSFAISSITALCSPLAVRKCQSIENIGSVMRVDPALASRRSFACSARATSAAQM